MIKTQAVIEKQINGKTFMTFCVQDSTWGEVFDYACLVRQYALDKMNERIAEEEQTECKKHVCCQGEEVCL